MHSLSEKLLISDDRNCNAAVAVTTFSVIRNRSNNIVIARISYRVTHFFRNRAAPNGRKKSTARCDRLVVKSQPIRSRKPYAILPVFPFTSKLAIASSFFASIDTHTHVYVLPWFIFYRRFSSTLLPFSRLPSSGCHPICRDRSNHLPLHPYSCPCVFQCADVCAPSYNSAQICFNTRRCEILGISRRIKLNTSPDAATITRLTLINAQTKNIGATLR